MKKTFRFMTGASQYQCEARDREEALKIAWSNLEPDPRQWLLIQATLYEEEAARIFHAEPGHEYEE